MPPSAAPLSSFSMLEELEEQPTQTYSPTTSSREKDEEESPKRSPIEDEPRSIMEIYTPKILTSMETVADEESENVPDTMCQIFLQSLFPFFLGGCGSVSAGLLLTYANKNLDLIKEIPEFLVLMPPLQGLRGNLDMTFSSRMSTLAHKGAFAEKGMMRRVRRNAAVSQALSIVVCIIANLISLIIVSMTPDLRDNESSSGNSTTVSNRTVFPSESDLNTIQSSLFLTGASILSVALNCAICTAFLFAIVYYAWKKEYNPDNIVAPLGASISDMLTIGSMLFFCYLLRPYAGFASSVPIVIIIVAICSIPVWIMMGWKDDMAVTTAKEQCLTLVFASIVSCLAGFLQSEGALSYPNYPAYQTLISGLAGNRGAVLASRISSHLETRHESELGWRQRSWPIRYYRSNCSEAQTARLLLFTAVPFQMIFVGLSTALSYIYEPVELDWKFFVGYALVVLLQSTTILYFSQLVVFALWKLGLDPDNHAIPLITSAADVCGCGLLYCLFSMLDAAFGCVRVQ